MRCMTIAGELARMEGNVEKICFLCADTWSAALVGEHGFQAEVLESDYRNMESEFPALKKLFGQKFPGNANVILVDSYYVTDAYLEGLKAFGRVALLDDLGEHRFPADCIINYNAYADRSRYESLYGNEEICLVLGCRYAPVRDQFLNRGYQVRSEVKKVLITTGGGDADNIAGQILDRIGEENREYYLVSGQFNPYFRELKELEKHSPNVHILHNVAEMGDLMEMCDLAITAGGSTLYELAAVGVPFLCFSYAENQEALTEYIGEKNIAGFCGAYHRDREGMLERLAMLFLELSNDFKKRRTFHDREQGMIDGGGARRLAEVLRGLFGKGRS